MGEGNRTMSHRTQIQTVRKILAVLLSLCLALTLAMQAALPARADDKQKELESQKQQAQEELDALKEEQQDNQENLESAQQDREATAQKRTELEGQMQTIQQKIDELEAQIAEKEQSISEKQAEIDQKQADYDAQLDSFAERLTAMQYLQSSGSIQLLSSVSSMFQLLTYANVMESIAQQDQQICDDLNDQKAQLNAEKEELEAQKADLEAQEAQQQSNVNSLEATTNELTNTIMALDSSISEAEAREQALASAISDKQAEFNRIADELDAYLQSIINDAQNSIADAPISCSLNFICPLDSYKYISCQYGAGGHKGVDFAAAGNTPIRAVASGKVITSAYHYSYGNYVMVYHGTDDQGVSYTTLYAHMIQTPSVSVGQAVSQGDVLGYVGSTGNSTGNHLHLELRVNGARTNPLNYVPH